MRAPGPNLGAVELQGIASLYRQTLYRTGEVIPQLEPYLAYEPFDPAPAQLLIDKHAALPDPYACRFGQAELSISRGVFCPTLTRVSPFLLEHVVFRPDEQVLDAFTGSGGFAVNAALAGSRAVGYDISPAAVACATHNAARNQVSRRVDIRQGTLSEAVRQGEQFDLIVANPPLLPGSPTNPLEQAVFDSGLTATQELIAALPTILTKKGRAQVVTSDVIERRGSDIDIAALCLGQGLVAETTARQELQHETYKIHTIERARFATWIRPLMRKAAAFFTAPTVS